MHAYIETWEDSDGCWQYRLTINGETRDADTAQERDFSSRESALSWARSHARSLHTSAYVLQRA